MSIRLVGSIRDGESAVRICFTGQWLIDEGEFDEESFKLKLGEDFKLESDVGLTMASTFSKMADCVSLRGSFQMACPMGGLRVVEESITLILRDSLHEEVIVPFEAKDIGLLGIEGRGKNSLGQFKVTGCFHPPTGRLWCTKKYSHSLSAPVQLSNKRKREEDDFHDFPGSSSILKILA